jgi:hypothetical protein
MIGEYLKSLASSTGSLTVKNPGPELAEGRPAALLSSCVCGDPFLFCIIAFKPTHCAGWVYLFNSHHTKQKTHGTQSMGFKTNINLNQMQCFDSVFFRVSASAFFRVIPWQKCLFFFFFSVANSNSPMERSPWA